MPQTSSEEGVNKRTLQTKISSYAGPGVHACNKSTQEVEAEGRWITVKSEAKLVYTGGTRLVGAA